MNKQLELDYAAHNYTDTSQSAWANTKNKITKRERVLNLLKSQSYTNYEIAEELEIDLLEPYIAVQTINTSGAFVAKKAKTFKEEKKVADKAPVDGITIENLGDETNKIKKTNKLKLKKKEFNYIIKFADLYFEDSALILKKRLIDEYNLSNISIDKINNNVYRVYKGPFDNIKSIKIEFDKINLMDFDNIDIIKL